MKLDSELVRLFHQTREEARALRRTSEETRRRAAELIVRARDLCLQHEELLGHEARAKVQKDPQTQRGMHALRVEVLKQLKQSLSGLENLRMIPGHDPELRKLKEDIGKTIRDSEASFESNLR